MSLASIELRDLALKLLACETSKDVGTDGAAAMKVCGRLGELLSKLAGTEGFRSLMARALALSRSEVQWLAQVSVADDGMPRGLDVRTSISPADARQGEVLFIANLLGLLTIFIGEQLTTQLVKELWPEASQ